jgi:hypothetical protein
VTSNPTIHHPDRSPDHSQGIEELDSNRADIGLVVLGRSGGRADAPGLPERFPRVQWDLVALGNGAVNTMVPGRQEIRKDVGMTAICTLLWFISFAAEAGPPVGFRMGGSDIMKKK